MRILAVGCVAFLLGLWGLPVVAETSIQMGAIEATLGLDYKMSINHIEPGHEDTANADASSYSSMGVERFFILFEGQVNPETSFNLAINTTDTSGVEFEVAKVNRTFAGIFTVSYGYNYTNVTGFDSKLYTYNLVDTTYNDKYGLFGGGQSQPVLEFSMPLAGTLTLQVTEDVAGTWSDGTTEYSYYSSMARQPAVTFEWAGELGPVEPLLQVASYDANHSLYYGGGFKVAIAGFEFIGEGMLETRKEKVVGADGKSKGLTHEISNYGLQMDYTVGSLKPGIEWAQFDYKQPKDSELGRERRQYNVGDFDNNAQDLGVGVTFLGLGSEMVPTLKYLQTTGEFLKDSNVKETRTRTQYALEIAGSF